MRQGVGIGTFHDYGPEFTITFSTNPGILKTIELDTAQITNTGVTDYWVANMRQGQFNSRYSRNLGRINTLIYGSKYLYTNEDISGSVAANTLVKVGGQEFMVEDYSGVLSGAGNFAYDGQAANGSPDTTAFTDPSKSFRLTLSEPFLGTSIIPVLTDTGAVATSIASTGVGAAPTISGAFAKAATSSDYLEIIAATVATAKFAASGYCFSRGSTRIYPCSAHGITDATNANAIRGGSSAHADAGTATLAAGATDYSSTGPAHPYQFVDNLGPFKVSSYASATAIKYDVTQMDGISKFYTASDYAKVPLNIYQVIDDADALPAGSILLMNGRRYKT